MVERRLAGETACPTRVVQMWPGRTLLPPFADSEVRNLAGERDEFRLRFRQRDAFALILGHELVDQAFLRFPFIRRGLVSAFEEAEGNILLVLLVLDKERVHFVRRL